MVLKKVASDQLTAIELLDFLEERADFVRLETIRLIEIAKVGHYSSVFSCAEIFSTLYYAVMRLNLENVADPGRDRFLMGKGHAAVGLYPILADLGFLETDVLNNYTRLGNPLGDHPDMTKVPGIDFSSGSIGHALSNGLGMVLGARVMNQDFATFVLLGDGEMQEGQVWEAALSAAHHRARNLIAIIDRNGFQLDGSVDDVIGVEPLRQKWESFGWDVREVDGHNVTELLTVFNEALNYTQRDKPLCVIARTSKGKGVSYMESEPGWHLGYLDPLDAQRAADEIRSHRRAS